jgi:hypothetical protein
VVNAEIAEVDFGAGNFTDFVNRALTDLLRFVTVMLCRYVIKSV